jgi:hypothetical protein
VSPPLLPLDQAAEAQRATRIGAQFSAVAPGPVQNTTDVLFRDLWRRPGLAPRDRSLVTVSALIASGQVAQIPHHLNRAMDNGLTQGPGRRSGHASCLLRRLAERRFGAAGFEAVFEQRQHLQE